MRTTVTLDPHVEAHVRGVMRERGLTFKQALNDAVRRGFATAPQEPAVTTPTFSMGEPTVPLDGALRLAADLEDDALVRRLPRDRITGRWSLAVVRADGEGSDTGEVVRSRNRAPALTNGEPASRVVTSRCPDGPGRGLEVVMAVAGSIALIILGAVVAFAVDAEIAGLDIRVVGYIIMIVGVVGLVFGLTVRRREQRGDHPGSGGQAKP